MPEARDRRVTPLDVDTLFTNRRPFSIYQDSDLLPAGSDRFVAQRTAFGRGITRPRGFHAPGNENTPPVLARRGRTRGGASRSILPSWYPRTPLRDITAVVRAIERRRSRLGEEEIQQTGTPISGNQLTVFSDPASFSASGSRAYKNSPKSCIKLKTPHGSKVPKILIDITNLPQEDAESEFLTPEKKLLNSIDTVEKALAQELMKLKRTPSAKKAEREKRVRTLMSMR
ncbi:protein POLYCHOME [Trifolium repens]|nr:protein POLYCHOME [Trifolium repens]